MNQSIYTERENILPHHAEWLDGCGAVWWINRVRFSLRHDISEVSFIAFCVSDNTFLTSYDESYTHIPTGTEFCERVAEILGLPKPTFEVDISKTETTTKGMAIEVSRLSEEERNYIQSLRSISCLWNEWTYCSFTKEYNNLCNKDYILLNDITITESPTEFLEYVGKQTGKEYKVEVDPKLSASMIHDSLDDGPSFADIKKALFESDKDDYKIWNYPHKTYRILDSLDGIPLDKRIPLSEWIPPCKSEVLFILKDIKFFGEFVRVDFEGIVAKDKLNFHFTTKDGHWMRIV